MMRENTVSLIYAKKYSTCILGFPLESVKRQEKRNELVDGILTAMEK